jgi:hypothetical protein
MPSPSEQNHPRPARLIEVAPGTEILPVDLRKVPQLGVFDWTRKKVVFPDSGKEGFAYVPVVRVHDAWMRISEAEKLPLGLSEEVIVKLIRGGFVEGGRGAPNSKTVNVISLLDHIEETRANPDFWGAEERRRYKEGA